jgi:hypothetical protein
MWDSFIPKDKVWYRWNLNGAFAYLRKDGDTWQTAFKSIAFQNITRDFQGPEEADPPDVPVFFTWGKGLKVVLHPYLSAKPYLVTVKEKARVLPGIEGHFITVLPPIIKFELGPDAVLSEAMPFILPETWFGSDTVFGEKCLSLPGGLYPHPIGQSVEPMCFRALICCEIFVKNTSKTVFDLERLAIYPEPLNVYTHDGYLLSDSLELEFLGADLKVDVSQAKSESKGYKIISSGTKSGVGDILVRRSVDIIKNITKF